ncbi:hypothetical protein OG871_37580 [Kitasatospora sp. NBC_00374]|uniref:hypothetical protein n=1 Tax=Kitasatospora sp. NBC_00374 TaxID=2975964 RepID=UPI0030E50CCF
MTEVNDTDEQTLRRIIDELQDTTTHDGPANVSGFPAVVPDNQDNPMTGAFTATEPPGQRQGDNRAGASAPARLLDTGSVDSSTPAAHRDHALRLGKAQDLAQAGLLSAGLARVLGTDHRVTLAARHAHALRLGEAGARAEAARLLAELAEDYARVLGPDHHATLAARHAHANFAR